MKWLKEFKEFAMRGNVVDLAVGIIIGAAFTTIVNSLVKDVLMPPIGMATGGVDFSDKKVTLQSAVMEGEKVVKPLVTLNYGNFINAIIQFLIVAFAIFLVVKAINTARRQPENAGAPPAPTKDQELLGEIRDLLRTQSR
ncbi:MAG: large-conductance mechanosensitive channel protein MscL [Tepidisphaeraceae bacterium]